MADTRTDFTKHHKTTLSFYVKLVLGMVAMSVFGLAAMFFIVNTTVRGAIYDNVLGIVQRDKAIQTSEIDIWFGTASQTVNSLATVLQNLSSEHYFLTIAESFVAEYDFIENVFIGFADGRAINGAGFVAPENWLSTDRPWFVAAEAAGEGVMATTSPYMSYATGNIAITVSKWVPGIGDGGAAVGAAVSLSPVLYSISRHPVMANGYMVLLGPYGEIFFHPDHALEPDGEIPGLRDIPGGYFLMDNLAAGVTFGGFDHVELGPAYFTATPLKTVDWTLVVVVPAEVARAPVSQSLAAVIIAFSAVMIGLFAFTIFFFSYLTRSMEERRFSEERMRILIDNMPLVANISGRDSSVVECNAEAPRVFGLRDKREYMERFFDLQPEFQPDGRSSREKALEMDDIAFREGYHRFEWMHQHANGKPVPCEVTLVRVRWRGEDQLLSFVRDLREFYEVRRKEDEINERMRLMLDATPLAIKFWDKEFNLVDCNKTAVALFEFSSKEEYRERWVESLLEPQPDGAPALEAWKGHLGNIFDSRSDRFEFACRKASGEIVRMEVAGYRMTFNNEPVAVTCCTDVTQLQETTKRMQEAEERVQLMLDGTPIACYLIDKNFEAIDCNKETLNLFDFESKADGIGKFREIFSRYRFDKLEGHFDRALRNGSERFEWILQKPDGSGYIPCDIALIRFSHRGEYVVAAYIFDQRVLKEVLWERQRVETAEAHSKAKSRFLARMSQEIRSPITAILDTSEVQLRNKTLPPTAEGAFARVQASAGALLQIVNDLLDLSEIEAGKTTIECEEYGVAVMLGDVLRMHLAYMSNKKVEFGMKVDESIPAFLVGDELRIRQIVSNLLSNAFKYTLSGSVELSLQCHKNAAEGFVTLAVCVRDTGQGMTPEQIDEMYSEYAHFNDQENRSVKGTGLGMPIVYRLAQMMDAQISVESAPGKGTTVVVRIPQKIAGDELLGKETAEDILKEARSLARSSVEPPGA